MDEVIIVLVSKRAKSYFLKLNMIRLMLTWIRYYTHPLRRNRQRSSKHYLEAFSFPLKKKTQRKVVIMAKNFNDRTRKAFRKLNKKKKKKKKFAERRT